MSTGGEHRLVGGLPAHPRLDYWLALFASPTDLPGFSHVNGVWWYDAPIPRRWHRCKPWSISVEHGIERCACGAIRFRTGPGSGIWDEKNSRTKP